MCMSMTWDGVHNYNQDRSVCSGIRRCAEELLLVKSKRVLEHSRNRGGGCWDLRIEMVELRRNGEGFLEAEIYEV
jgi:hypothetical protein